MGSTVFLPRHRGYRCICSGQTTDWGDVIYRNAVNQQYNLSISGGSDKATYYFSGGYYNEQGTTRKTGFERYNLTLKTDFDLAKNLKAGVSLFLNDSKKNGYLTDGDAFINPANYSRNANPYLQLTDEKGDYIYDPDIEGYSGRYVKFNYLEEVDNTDYTLKNRSIKPLFTLDYRLTDWLNYKLSFLCSWIILRQKRWRLKKLIMFVNIAKKQEGTMAVIFCPTEELYRILPKI